MIPMQKNVVEKLKFGLLNKPMVVEKVDDSPMGKLLATTVKHNRPISMLDILNTAKTEPNNNTKPYIGGMITFNYAPESHRRLPHWDRFPMLMVTDIKGDLFRGINLLYLPPVLREKLINHINTSTDRHKDETTKARLTYKILQHATKLKEFLPCVKTYHIDGVKSKFMNIHQDHWNIATKLPMAKFNHSKGKL